MKLINLFKSIPLLTVLIILILLNINNNKVYTKLKFLIWETPSLSLGAYLSISTVTGFIISYIVNSNLVKSNKSNSNTFINYKVSEQKEDSNQIYESQENISYENTLIERDIREPSPTINASFRVIGKTKKCNSNEINNESRNPDISNYPNKISDDYYRKRDIEDHSNQIKSTSCDWNDISYENW